MQNPGWEMQDWRQYMTPGQGDDLCPGVGHPRSLPGPTGIGRCVKGGEKVALRHSWRNPTATASSSVVVAAGQL